MAAGRPTAVIAAFVSNLLIAAAKLAAFSFTGSSSMLAEGFHSIADTGNQALLLLGRHRSRRKASRQHPFGYAPERYFWAFVVAIILFAFGAVFSFWEGYQKLADPHPIESPAWAFGVLGMAIVVESVALTVAVKEANRTRTGSWWRHIRSTKDAENSVVLLEDSAAEVGLVIALAGVSLAVATGDARWDALGSLAIGAILAFVSGLLATEMRSLLIGEAAGPENRARIVEAIRAEPTLERLVELRTMHLGPDDLMVTARIELDARLTFDDAARAVAAIESRIRKAVPIASEIFIEPATADHDREAMNRQPRRVFDISAPLTDRLVTWPGVVEQFDREVVASPELGDPMVVSALRMGAHCGTHVDAPCHFVDGGGGVESVPLSALVGPAYVAEIPDETAAVSGDLLDRLVPPDAKRILLKTRNSGWSTSGKAFREDYVACDESVVDWLLSRDTALLGIDYLSVEPFDADERDYPVHRALLGAGVAIVESLDLAGVPPGRYELAVLPLLIPGSDGAPARAVLVEGGPDG